MSAKGIQMFQSDRDQELKSRFKRNSGSQVIGIGIGS
jgi:hypothetical protein